MEQETVRKKYLKQLEREKQKYISSRTGIYETTLTYFKRGLQLKEGQLKILNDYLEGKLDTTE